MAVGNARRYLNSKVQSRMVSDEMTIHAGASREQNREESLGFELDGTKDSLVACLGAERVDTWNQEFCQRQEILSQVLLPADRNRLDRRFAMRDMVGRRAPYYNCITPHMTRSPGADVVSITCHGLSGHQASRCESLRNTLQERYYGACEAPSRIFRAADCVQGREFDRLLGRGTLEVAAKLRVYELNRLVSGMYVGVTQHEYDAPSSAHLNEYRRFQQSFTCPDSVVTGF
jgi:hypothetical protein